MQKYMVVEDGWVFGGRVFTDSYNKQYILYIPAKTQD